MKMILIIANHIDQFRPKDYRSTKMGCNSKIRSSTIARIIHVL